MIITNQKDDFCKYCCDENLVFKSNLDDQFKLSEFLDNTLKTKIFKTSNYFSKSKDDIFLKIYEPNLDKVEKSLIDHKINDRNIFDRFLNDSKYNNQVKKCYSHKLYPNRRRLFKYLA